ncbi:MAG TPA: Ivy family c-type lysozyme inhibitor [Methylovirgula sp.]|jgi:hypothetical protein|nr:Ivy family c-type lysozyme inhibitor [Methylovirgula sp.]
MISKRFAALSAGALLTLMTCSALPARAANPYLFDLMKQPAYRKAYLAMMKGAKDLPFWLDQITGKEDYVTAPADIVTIAGTSYFLVNACQPHECDTNAIEVLFSAGGAHAYALLIEDGKPNRWFGNPNAAQQAELGEPLK